jgi:serine protease Do
VKGVIVYSSLKRWGVLLSFVLVGVIIGFVISSNTELVNSAASQTQLVRATPAPKSIYPITQEGKSPFVGVVEKVRDAVVNIKSERIEQLTPSQKRWMQFWGWQGDSPREVSMGTGFFFREDGYILTNHHVIAGARDITVTLADRAEIKAKLIGEDAASDLAVLKITGSSYPYIELGDSDSIKVGEWVMAIGNPFPTQGLDRTVTVGVVSAKGRRGLNFGEDTPDFQDYIQTDAAINPGNSGGPLVNLDGYVIGINAAIASSSGQSAGIGFAIPSNFVKSVVTDLMTKGKVQRGWLGVTLRDIDANMAEANGLASPRGVLIEQVRPQSPAEHAGLRDGDIVTKFNGDYVEDQNHFRYLVAGEKMGSIINLQIYRKGKPTDLQVTIGDRDEGLAEAQPTTRGRTNPGGTDQAQEDGWLGMGIQTATTGLAEQFGVDFHEGVIVVSVEQGSAADIEGVTPGTILIEINHEDVKTAGDFDRIKGSLQGRTKAIAMIGYDYKGNVKYFAIKPN